MRKILLTASALMSFTLAFPAFAQAPATGPTGQGANQAGGASQNDEDRDEQHEMMMRRMLRGMMRGPRMEGMMARFAHELAQGVFYRVKHGDDEVILHCPANMVLNACVSGATELLKAMTQPQ
jgi:hypothetical protein